MPKKFVSVIEICDSLKLFVCQWGSDIIKRFADEESEEIEILIKYRFLL